MPRGEDVFVRLESRFVLEDPRLLRHKLAARAVFVHLSALAVSGRREFLPAHYTVEMLAISLHCRPKVVRVALDELTAAMPDPLIGRLSDGRVRVMDVRKCHGAKFRWINEDTEFAAWTEENADMPSTYPRMGTNGDKRGQTGTNVPDRDKMAHDGTFSPEVRGKKGEVRRERGDSTASGPPQGPRAVAVEKRSIQSPPCKSQLPGDVLQAETLGNVTTGMILKWMKDPKVFRHWEKLRHKVFAVNEQDPVTLLAHVIEINNSKRIKSKPATLMMRLTKPRPGTTRRVPADKWYDKAKQILNGSPTKAEVKKRKKSKPESLGEILKGDKQ